MKPAPDDPRLHFRLQWEDLDASWLRARIGNAREEDLEGAGLRQTPRLTGDITTALLPANATGRAQLVAREDLVACGLGLLPLILQVYGGGVEFEPACNDGQNLPRGGTLGTLTGNVCTLLSAERVLLNYLQRLSGVARETRRYVNALGASPTRLLDTRKTTPGLRVLEKYATACGGGWNHRIGLFDRVMLKDNHLAAAGAAGGAALSAAVAAARSRYPELLVEVEVDRLEQIAPVLEAGAHIILLDNFSTPELTVALNIIRGRAATEASGGISLGRLPELAGLGLDFISTGATVHRAAWVDIGLDWS